MLKFQYQSVVVTFLSSSVKETKTIDGPYNTADSSDVKASGRSPQVALPRINTRA